jgi:DNA-binding transcriptional ArsR family regulator
MTAAWKTSLSQTPKMVLLALCDNANDEGECYPSVQTLAAKCSVSDRAVQMQLTKLEEMGYVAREIRTGRSTVYHIRKPSEWPSTPERRSPPKDVHPRTTFTTGVKDVHPTPERRSPITIKEPSVNHQSNNRGARLPADWYPEDGLLKWAVETRPDLYIPAVVEQFRDYWIAVPGAKGRKLDWQATFKNWVRNQRQQPKPGNSQRFMAV